MNKNIIKLFAILMMCFLLGSVLVACGNTNEGEEDIFTVEIKNGNWFINGVDTGVKAEGKDGQTGLPGQNGADLTDKCENEKHDYNIYNGEHVEANILVANGNKWIIEGHKDGCQPKKEIIAGQEPTCVASGKAQWTCDCPRGTLWVCVDCGEARFEWFAKEIVDVDALGHNYESKTTPATCTAEGFTTHTCTVCGDTYKDATTAKVAHTYGEWYESDYGSSISTCVCNRPVYRAHTCTVCTYTEHEKVKDAPGHIFREEDYDKALPNAFESPCVQTPREVAICSVCQHKDCNQYRDIAGATAEGHSANFDNVWTIVVGKEPTATSKGWIETKCTKCGDSHPAEGYKTKEIPALNTTDYKCEETPATCTTNGKRVYTLNADPQIVIEVVIPAKGHDFNDSTELTNLVAPSYAAAGSVTVGCKDCNATENVVIPTLNDATKTYITEKGNCYGKLDKYTMTLKTADGDEFEVEFSAKGDYVHDEQPADKDLTLINPSVEGEKAYWGYWCTKCEHWIFVKEAN